MSLHRRTTVTSLPTHSSFPDLATLEAEALARLVTVVRRCKDTLRSSLVRMTWPSLDSSLARLAAPEPGCARTLAGTAAWLLQVHTLLFCQTL